MKLFHRLSFLLAVCATVLAQDGNEARELRSRAARVSILFKNGDLLFGQLHSIDRENGIRWNRADASPTRLPPSDTGRSVALI